ncbi:hypothetical protein PVW51_13910 [Sulfitobacter sp. PR48]|uniref:hypothetical protein n=1 Tax=Sulfitobacter sp. PR48 TaxID=3028383 RepID=UPI00237AC764|nr:hypothetical protein [Sulfitobacter sp. PR48]MDD9721799.1 hypothetical protein [Sulfitobacter sp. PR48]
MNTATEHDVSVIKEEFLQFVADAAQQDSFLALDANDWDGQKLVGAIPIYAVDSNIVHMFVNPLGHAQSNESRSIGYGEVFRSDSTDKKAAITLALADFIWHDLCPDRPLLLLPGVDREVATLIQVSASRNAPSPDAVDQITKLQQELYATNDETQRTVARRLASAIIDIKRGGRLMALERLKRFAPVDDLHGRGTHGFPPDVLAVLTPPNRISDMLEYAVLRNDWQDLMALVGRADPERLPVSRDIDALSYLEFWNRRLVNLDKPHRLVYITGDVSILRAASQRSAEDFRLGDLPEQSGPTPTFLDAFIRHPRSLFDRPGVLRSRGAAKTVPNVANSIKAWLRLLLGEYQDEHGNLGHWNWPKARFDLADAVERDVLEVAARKPEVLQEARDSWSGFTESVSLADLIDGNMFPEGDRDKEYRVGALLDWLKEHGAELNDEVENYWRDCVLAFTEFRFLLDIISKRPPTHRRAPQLCLEGTEPQTFLDQAKRWLADPKSFNSETYEEYKNRLNEADGNDYNFLVAIAFILASGGNWHSTAFLCAHARLVSDRQILSGVPKNTLGPNGREAAYLEAFARRHLARKAEDLDVCIDLVEKAIAIYRDECSGEGKIPKSGDPIMERFNGERLAINYTLEMLACDGQLQRANVAALVALREEFFEFLRTLDQADEPESACQHVLELSSHRALLNIVSIGVFLGPKNWDADSARNYCERLQKIRITHAGDQDYRSEYSEIVTWAGLALFGEPRQRREALLKARKGIDEVLASKHIREIGFIYENARYQSFRKNLEVMG